MHENNIILCLYLTKTKTGPYDDSHELTFILCFRMSERLVKIQIRLRFQCSVNIDVPCETLEQCNFGVVSAFLASRETRA